MSGTGGLGGIGGTPASLGGVAAVRLVWDLFTEAVDTALTSHTPLIGGAWSIVGGVGGNYTVRGATDDLLIDATGGTRIAIIDSTASAVDIQSTVTLGAARDVYLISRYSNASNFIIAGFQHASTELSIWRQLAGVWTQIAVKVSTYSAGTHTVRYTVSAANVHTLYINGTQELQITDANLATNTIIGIYNSNDPGAVFDNFDCYAFGQRPV